jgi:hypothetical protein
MPDAPTGPWLSIITVVKDDPEGFVRTTASIAGQDLAGVEWVVIDGSANAAVIPGILAQQAPLNATYSWHQPQGVYPAMNAGLEKASGAYVFFANAGDTFYDDSSVTEIHDVVSRDSPVWLFGQTAFVSSSGVTVTPPPFDYAKEKALNFSRGRFPPHQGTVASRPALLSFGGFDTKYRVSADYAAFLRLSLLADPAMTTGTIATFHAGGLSSKSWRESVRDMHRARLEILRPTGVRALRERLETASQITRMTLARLIGRVKD